MRVQAVLIGLILMVTHIAAEAGQATARPKKRVTKTCDGALAAGGTSSALPSFHLSDAAYAKYLTWLHTTIPKPRVQFPSYPLGDTLKKLAMTPEDLARVGGRVLLAGEGDLGGIKANGEPLGLYGTIMAGRGGRSDDVVALDLAYDGRTANRVEGSVTRMPFADGSFDFVASNMVAHFLRGKAASGNSVVEQNQQAEFVLEVRRVLRPGGHARIGLFVDQDVTNGVGRIVIPEEISSLEAAIGTKAHFEFIHVQDHASALILTK